MIYHGDGSDSQQWLLESAGNGNYFIKNLYGYYLDVCDGVDANGTNVGTWKKNGSAAQQWKFTCVSGKNLANIADGDYMIYSKVGNKVLNAAGNGTANGTNLQISDPLDVSGNIFTTYKNGRFVTRIKNKASNRMVDSLGGQPKPENVNLWDDNNGYGQSWYIEDAGDGYVYIRNLWGYYLDVDNGNNVSGTNVQTWEYNGSDARKWKFVKYDKIAVTGISLNSYSASLTEGGNYPLSATVTPGNASNRNVSWSSSNTNVATVDSNGMVKAVKAGTATITARTEDGGKTAGCTVTVKAKVSTPSVKNMVTKYNGKYVYFNSNSKPDYTYTGVAKSTSGSWVFVKKGIFDSTYSGVARSTTGNRVYVKNGRYYTQYTGVAQSTTGNRVYVKNGRYYTKATGVARSTSGNYVYVKNGRYYTNYTGLTKSLTTGDLVYVRKGRYYPAYNGKAVYNGKTYTVRNGRV